ncbi:MAG: AsmA family protein [Acidobacteria bacterium]|nr:AsmA family protein [Acidobacteriota bacterium]
MLLLAAGLVLPSLIDVERFRPQIERVLQESTGWDAELGDIELSLFRGALSVSPASLTAPGGDTSRIEIGRIDVKAGLLPLLRKELRIERIRLVRPEILLVRTNEDSGWIVPIASSEQDANGETPRERAVTDAVQPDAAETVGSSGDATGEQAGSESDGFVVVIDEIGIRDGTLRLEDRALTPPLSIKINEVTASFFPADGSVVGRLSFGEHEGEARWRGQLDKTIEVTLKDLKTELLQAFLGPDLIRGGGRLSGEVTLAFPLRIEGNLTVDGLTLLSGERPFDAAGLEFVISPLGVGWQLERLEFNADGVRLVGSGALSPALALQLELPDTALEAVLRASESVLPLPIEVVAPGNVSATIRVDQPEGGELTYEASGSFSAAEVRPGDLLPAAKDVQATFVLDRAGRLEVQIVSGTIAGGPANGRAVIEPIYPPGTLQFSGGLRDAVFGQLLGGLVDEAKPVTGPTGFDAALGVDLSREVLDARSLSGKVEFSARSLSMPGWNLDQAVRGKLEQTAGSGSAGLLRGLLGKDGKSDTSAGDVVETVERLIDSLEGTINFDRWPWGLEDVRLAVGDVSSTGSGSFDPEQGTVAFSLTAQLTREASDALVARYGLLKVLRDRSGRLTLPVRIEGSLMAPSIKVDVDAALKGNLLGGGDKEDDVKSLLRGLFDRKKKKND